MNWQEEVAKVSHFSLFSSTACYFFLRLKLSNGQNIIAWQPPPELSSIRCLSSGPKSCISHVVRTVPAWIKQHFIIISRQYHENNMSSTPATLIPEWMNFVRANMIKFKKISGLDQRTHCYQGKHYILFIADHQATTIAGWISWNIRTTNRTIIPTAKRMMELQWRIHNLIFAEALMCLRLHPLALWVVINQYQQPK